MESGQGAWGMTTASVNTSVVINLCDKARTRIHSLIRESPVHKPPEIVSPDFLPDVEEFFQYESLKNLYEELNFILRLRELCAMAEGVNLSLKDYSRLIKLTGDLINYSPSNPIDA